MLQQSARFWNLHLIFFSQEEGTNLSAIIGRNFLCVERKPNHQTIFFEKKKLKMGKYHVFFNANHTLAYLVCHTICENCIIMR